MITKFDLAWASVNALGGTAAPDDEYGKGFAEAIGAALQVLEELGAEDPLTKRANGVQ